jgi:hypothetical protein
MAFIDREIFLNNFHEKFQSRFMSGSSLSFVNNSNGKLNISQQPILHSHRFGWKSVVNSLAPLHNINGIKLYSFLENEFIWNSHHVNLSKPWVGFLHNPCDIPPWYSSDLAIHLNQKFYDQLSDCLGIFVLSNHHKNQLLPYIDNVPINVLHHPYPNVEVPRFDYNQFKQNPQFLNVGYWLRKQTSFFNVSLPGKKIKIWPYLKDSAENNFIYVKLLFESEALNIPFDQSSVSNLYRLSDIEYDKIMSKSIVFLDLFDSSANNIIIECIHRNTPVICNRHPAVEEYLGKDYPLFFDAYSEINTLISEVNILKAIDHLKQIHNSGRLTIKTFISNFQESPIYLQL